MSQSRGQRRMACAALCMMTVAVTGGCASTTQQAGSSTRTTTPAVGATESQAVGPQYDTVHVYVKLGQFDTFVRSWIATFGGTTSAKVTVDVTPTPSTTASQL